MVVFILFQYWGIIVLYHIVGTTSCSKHAMNNVLSKGISVSDLRTSLGKLSIRRARPMLAVVTHRRYSSVVIGLCSSKVESSFTLESVF